MPRTTSQQDPWKPRRSVLIADRIASVVITLGGLAVLAAVLGICVYLASVVLPLFGEGDVDHTQQLSVSGVDDAPVILELDEPGLGVMTLSRDGVFRLHGLADGQVVSEHDLGQADRVTAAASAPGSSRIAIAFESGQIFLGDAGIPTQLLRPDAINAPGDAEGGVFSLPSGSRSLPNGGIVEQTGEDGYRAVTLDVDLGSLERVDFAPAAIDLIQDSRGESIAIAAEDGTVSLYRRTVRENFLTGEETVNLRESRIESGLRSVAHVFLLDRGETLLVLDDSGQAKRIDVESGSERESVDLSGGLTMGSAVKLPGSRSVAIGVPGGARVWFVARDATAGTPDGRALVLARTLKTGREALVRTISPGAIERVVLLAGEDGGLTVDHGTSGKKLAQVDSGAPVAAAAVSPRGDAFASISPDGRLMKAGFEPGYPEVTFTTLFLPVKYEGEAAGSFVYQSSAAGDDAEVKISLTPLIFGTLKATVFAMLFATPIAVLAAVFSSEFMGPKMRRVVKPTIELMASLPSVVLGYVAAMIVAPLVRDHLSGVLLAFALIPMSVMIASQLWQFLPWRIVSTASAWTQVGTIAVAVAVGAVVSVWAGPLIEPLVFAPLPDEAVQLGAESAAASTGLIPWLDGRTGSAWAGWVLVLFAPAAASVWLVFERVLGGSLRDISGPASVPVAAAISLAKLVILTALSLILAMLLARVVTAFGWDIREGVFGSFTPRNTLVVGIIMGFAVIPIIYTISDDALVSVPASLRAASLGAGATPWQTALRVVLPVAASGIFSAIMIGLGRAVGETMIVLMATGNTPTMDWNIFAGFRTLAANIAVELPEAPVGGGHYRVLFLCGFVLFIMTLLVNTTAELVRQRFRKRNAML